MLRGKKKSEIYFYLDVKDFFSLFTYGGNWKLLKILVFQTH